MKVLFVTLLCLGSLSAFAEKPEEGKTFEEKKAHSLSRIEEKLKNLNDSKTCVTSAADENALKACREKMRAHRKDMKKMWDRKKKK
jgi:hypothetical protein